MIETNATMNARFAGSISPLTTPASMRRSKKRVAAFGMWSANDDGDLGVSAHVRSCHADECGDRRIGLVQFVRHVEHGVERVEETHGARRLPR